MRIVLKATVANLEIRKPAGKWEKIAGAAYAKIEAHAESGIPGGLGLQTIPGFTRLMQDTGVIVYGRKTYELMVPYWPDVAKNKSGDPEELAFADDLWLGVLRDRDDGRRFVTL